MKKGIYVINLKNIVFSLMMIVTLIIINIAGNKIIDNVVETVSNGRLLPIYSVETTDKKVSITFDCAWSGSR